MNRLFALIIITIITTVASSRANNLQIGPVTLTTANGSQYLNFIIGWNNSWRTSSAPFNWDAVWVFVKRRDCASLQWRHVNLSPEDSSHMADNPLLVDAYADKKGVMIYRSGNGFGNLAAVNIKLKMDSVPFGDYDYQVHGIEMVYVPQGSFYAGDGVSLNSFRQAADNNPFMVNGEGPIGIGLDSNNLFSVYSGTPDNSLFPGTVLPAAYPKGYEAFYIMKYEISQGQYASFLNSITNDAAANRYLNGVSGIGRYTISGNWPQFTCTSPDRACNWLSFQDLAAYLDWSALSPMTELEFEKSCRGSGNVASGGEMAWGSIKATDANNIAPGTDGTSGEYVVDIVDTGRGLANYEGSVLTFSGPLRCGFAARTATNRYQAGATYYGVMEMSGNLLEPCYNLAMFNPGSGPTGGGFFTGQHGDGELATTPGAGNSNAGWPLEAYIFPQTIGYSVASRGGSCNLGELRLRVSDRLYTYNTETQFAQARTQDSGGRGVSRRQ